jgi:hypothetical protein
LDWQQGADGGLPCRQTTYHTPRKKVLYRYHPNYTPRKWFFIVATITVALGHGMDRVLQVLT